MYILQQFAVCGVIYDFAEFEYDRHFASMNVIFRGYLHDFARDEGLRSSEAGNSRDNDVNTAPKREYLPYFAVMQVFCLFIHYDKNMQEYFFAVFHIFS